LTQTGSNWEVKVNYNRCNQLAQKIAGLLADEGATHGEGVVAAMLLILNAQMDSLTFEQEVKFVQDMSEYIGAYWGEE
jgi:hypothetical protein